MQIGRGDMRSARQRSRDRYRGCRVCGVRGVQCTTCDEAAKIVAERAGQDLCLVVDGSFVPATPDRLLGYGGAGLVLVKGPVMKGEILATCACGFDALDSSDAEFHAIIRGARWARGVPIYTDVKTFPDRFTRVNPELVVHYLLTHDRCPAHHEAHRLSVEGRLRQAPESAGPRGPEVALARAGKTKAERRQMGVDLLLAEAAKETAFDGNFEALAARMGWTSGKRWRENPAIKKAALRWNQNKELP